MKRVILSLMAVMAAVSMAAQGKVPMYGPDGQVVREAKGPGTNHTVSTTLGLGLEYGFEWAFLPPATLIARIGYASRDFTLRSALDNFQWSTTMSPMVTLEPRFYFWTDWEGHKGKYTSAFVGVPAVATLAKDAKGLGEVAVTPRVGVRRAFARHFFHEFTAGADLLCYPAFGVTPHVGYRIGLLF
jgi:predicted small lipoprotein YifL